MSASNLLASACLRSRLIDFASSLDKSALSCASDACLGMYCKCRMFSDFGGLSPVLPFPNLVAVSTTTSVNCDAVGLETHAISPKRRAFHFCLTSGPNLSSEQPLASSNAGVYAGRDLRMPKPHGAQRSSINLDPGVPRHQRGSDAIQHQKVCNLYASCRHPAKIYVSTCLRTASGKMCLLAPVADI
jgi:hypothetical protein